MKEYIFEVRFSLKREPPVTSRELTHILADHVCLDYNEVVMVKRCEPEEVDSAVATAFKVVSNHP